MTTKFKKGEKVRWSYGVHYAEGTVKSSFERRTTRKIKGQEITRNGSPENPAYYILQDDGATALKLGSELEGLS